MAIIPLLGALKGGLGGSSSSKDNSFAGELLDDTEELFWTVEIPFEQIVIVVDGEKLEYVEELDCMDKLDNIEVVLFMLFIFVSELGYFPFFV